MKWATCGHLGQTSLACGINFKTKLKLNEHTAEIHPNVHTSKADKNNEEQADQDKIFNCDNTRSGI